jgi:hypothetical protein
MPTNRIAFIRYQNARTIDLHVYPSIFVTLIRLFQLLNTKTQRSLRHKEIKRIITNYTNKQV